MTASASDQLAALDDVAEVLAQGPDRAALYDAVDAALQRLLGHRLFTLLAVLPGGIEVQRFWSSNAQAYPLTGRKRVGPTPWGEVVLQGKSPWLGNDAESIRWAFADHELIASLGLGACINIPIVHRGRMLGTMNILHAEHHYDATDVTVAARFAPYLVGAFSEEAVALAKEPDPAEAGSHDAGRLTLQ
jgi:GAF domain-containing protein